MHQLDLARPEAISGCVVISCYSANDPRSSRPDRRIRQVEIRVIQDVLRIHPDLELAGFPGVAETGSSFAQGEIDANYAWSSQDIPAGVAKRARRQGLPTPDSCSRWARLSHQIRACRG